MKEDKIKEITEQLEQGVKDVFTSENYRNYLLIMSKFHTYSLNNQLLIWMQRPEATYVAGYKTWQKSFKRQVRKGETSIKILAPISCKFKKQVETEDGIEEKEVQFNRFRAVSVFDISQTDGDDLPQIVTKLDGDVDGYEDLLQRIQAASPVPVEFKNIEGSANGYFHMVDKVIAIQEGMSQIQTVKTMIHEIAHSILHDRDDGTEKDADRGLKEQQAESVAYVVSNYIGLDTSDYSFGYVAGWSKGNTDDLKANLEVIRSTANQIIEKIA